MKPSSEALDLVADIGGTHARFALRARAGRALLQPRTMSAAEHADLASALAAYLQTAVSAATAGSNGKLGEGAALAGPTRACLAVASPSQGDLVEFTNSPWRFSRAALAARFGLARLTVLNDFEALALAVPHLQGAQIECLRAGEPEPRAVKAVLGPGTGLGVSGLVHAAAGRWIALPGEGGHVAFAPTDELEIELLRFLRRGRARVSIERVLSGEGLSELHEFLVRRARNDWSESTPAFRLDPAQVTARALQGSDAEALAAVDRFCAILGSVAGDLALTLGARGGVYLGGGILPRIESLLRASPFVARFLDKGRMRAVLEPIPVHLILDSSAALHGAAAALDAD